MKKLQSKFFMYGLIALTSAGTLWASTDPQQEEKEKTSQQSNTPPQDPSNVSDKVKKEAPRAVEDIKEGADKLGKKIEQALSKKE